MEAILIPIGILFAILIFAYKMDKHKYSAIIYVAKNIDYLSKTEEIFQALNYE
jgi:hypothetical protein